MSLWESLHFLRPLWLWGLLLLPLAMLGGWYRRRRRSAWQRAVDPHLLPHLLQSGRGKGFAGALALSGGLLLAVVALAGPSWRQLEQPLWESKTPLVIALDLSSSITASDLPPSRLLQARAKLATLLRERKGGDVALLAYAGEPFTVAPLTSDAANVALFLDALSPEIMPVDGQKAGKAIDWAVGLLQQARAQQGDILLLTGAADGESRAAAARAMAAGYRVSVLGLGTVQGAAYRDRRGQIAQTHLDASALQALASAGGGRHAPLTSTDADLQALGVLEPRMQGSDRGEAKAGKAWQDEGYWLLPPLMLLALFAFRRTGAGMAVVLLCVLMPLALPAQAAESSWWQRADQRDHQRLAEGVDAYRKGDFASAQRRFEGIDTDQGWYNLGNALARQGKYDEAIAAYDHALKQSPAMPDAVANRAAVDAARKRKSQQQQQGPQDQKGDSGKPESSPPQPGQEGQQQPQSAATPSSPAQQGKDSDASPSAAQPKDAPSQSKPDEAPQGEDAGKQQAADQAQRERMEQAMAQGQPGEADTKNPQQGPPMTAEERERRQAVEAWMQRVPDEPGNLLKTKFQLEYERRKREGR